jgi:hypothetical protein
MNDQPMQIGAFDPTQAFDRTVQDLISVIQLFQEEETIPPMEFLRAFRSAHETLTAVTQVTLTTLMNSVRSRIPDDVYHQHISEVEMEQLMSTPEQQAEKTIRALKNVATFVSFPRNNPPGV